MMLAGATAVEVGAANLVNPGFVRRLLKPCSRRWPAMASPGLEILLRCPLMGKDVIVAFASKEEVFGFWTSFSRRSPM